MAKNQVHNCDIYIAGDRHIPAWGEEVVAGRMITMLQLGTYKTNDTWGQRYFDMFTLSDMPCTVLSTSEKEITPFRTLAQAMKYCKK